MTKQQYKNLSHSFRWMKRKTTVREALGWVAHYSPQNAILMIKVYGK